MWIKISEHEHDCTAPFPHFTDSVQLHRAAALPWRSKALKAERPERGGPCCLLKQSQMETYEGSTNESVLHLVGSLGPCRYKRFY